MLGITVVLLLTRTSNIRYNVDFFPFCFFPGFILINSIFLKVWQDFFNSPFCIPYDFWFIFTKSQKFRPIYIFQLVIISMRMVTVIIFIPLKNWSVQMMYPYQDSNWIKGFFDYHDRVYSLNSLPPFEDNFKLKSLTKIITQFWIKPDIMSVNFKAQSTNNFLRYQNYLLPLINFAKKENWEIIQINNFGIVYRKREL